MKYLAAEEEDPEEGFDEEEFEDQYTS